MFQTILELLKNFFIYFKENPLNTIIIVGSIYATYKALCWWIPNLYRIKASKNLVFLKVVLPRNDSQKDREKENEKDFKEKIAIMSQFFRTLQETNELNIWNDIMTSIFKHNIFSFELVSRNKMVEFYITTPKQYKQIIIKQITSYYTNADVQPVDRYDFSTGGKHIKGYHAYTKNKFYFPIRTFKQLDNDPLNNMTNVFSKLGEKETGILQIVLRPRGNKWSKEAVKKGDLYYKDKDINKIDIPLIGPILNLFKGIILGADKMEIEKKDDGGGIVRMLQSKEEVAKRMGEKASQTGFDTVIRIIATAETEQRAVEISNDIVVGLTIFKDTQSNWFQTKRLLIIDSLNDKLILYGFKRRLLDFRSFWIGAKKSLLAEDEIASIFHFPSRKYNKSPIIKWMDYKVLPAPLDLPKEGIVIGINEYRGEKRKVRFLAKDRSRHQYIIGKSGSGKSALLSYQARQDAWNNSGLCIVDPHGDLVDDVLSYIKKDRVKDVIIFDPADTERPMSINMLEARNDSEKDLISSQATEIFIKLFGDEIFGPRIQHYFRNACLTLMDDEENGATLIDIPRIFTDEAFLKYKLKKVKNPVVKSFWENEYANTGDREKQEMIPYFSSKFGPFITNSIMRNTIGQKHSSFNFREVMDNEQILLVKLSKGTIGDLNTQLLGLIIVARIQMAAMSRADMPEEERKDFYLYVDEFQNFATDSFCSILSEARKYRLNLIMAHQYISQLTIGKNGSQNTQIRDAVFGNVGTLSSFKVGAEDAEYLAKEYAPLLTEQDILGISNYKMYMKLNIKNTTSRPFSVSTIWDTSAQNKAVGEKIRQYARLKHARKKEFVNEEIVTRIGIDIDEEGNKVEKNNKQ